MLIKSLANRSNLHWCILGDFNDMVNKSDKKGLHKHPQSLLDGFKRTVEECVFIDLDLEVVGSHGRRVGTQKNGFKNDWTMQLQLSRGGSYSFCAS